MAVFTYTDTNADTRNSTSLAGAFLSIFFIKITSFLAHITKTEAQNNWCEGSSRARAPMPAQSRVSWVLGFFRKEIPQPLWTTHSLGTTEDSGFTSLFYLIIDIKYVYIYIIHHQFILIDAILLSLLFCSLNTPSSVSLFLYKRCSKAFIELSPDSSCLSCIRHLSLWVHQIPKFI